MQKWLDSNDIQMYSTYNEDKSVVVKRFIKASKGKVYKKMTANDNKSDLGYLNKVVDEYNNTYHHSIGKNPINADWSALTEEIDKNPKSPKLKVGDRVRITKYKNIFSKNYAENWSIEIFVIYCEN